MQNEKMMHHIRRLTDILQALCVDTSINKNKIKLCLLTHGMEERQML